MAQFKNVDNFGKTEMIKRKKQSPSPAMKEYKRGDTLHYKNQDVVVVEVIEPDRLHLKNTKAPFNSFISLVSEIEESKASLFKYEFIEAVERIDDENAPDLMVREDKRVSL